MFPRSLLRFLAPCLLLWPLLSSCGGGGTGPSIPTPVATATPIVTATPTALPTATATTSATATPTPTSTALPAKTALQLLLDGHQIGKNFWQTGDTSTGGTGQDVASLGCGPMDESYHVHSHLSIFLNGEALAIPAAIGITKPTFQSKAEWPDGFVIYGDCHYGLHTHDTSGRLHVEAPKPGTFTLGQVFQIWGQPLSYSNIAGITGHPVVVYVNDGDNLRRYTGDLSAIPLVADREITIQIGTPVRQIPTYDWVNS